MACFAIAVAGNGKRFTANDKISKLNLAFVKSFPERLDHAIRRAGISKGTLAAGIGVPQSSVSRWLAGSEPRADKLEAIAKLLTVDVKWLMSGTGEPTPAPLPSASPSAASAPLRFASSSEAELLAVLQRIAAALERLAERE